MKTVVIPSDRNPWTCTINDVKYAYEAGTEQTVPDEVAAIINQQGVYPPEVMKPEQPWTPTEVSGYVKPEDLTPYAKTADVMAKASGITGYDKTKTQVLKNDNGTLKWVTEEPAAE